MGTRLIAGDTRALRGRTTVPGDKSISHRAVLLSCLATGDSRIAGFLESGDCAATIGVVRGLGVQVELRWAEVIVRGGGLHAFREPRTHLDCRGSGTTMRLVAGILAGQRFESLLDGSDQLRRRPMERIVEPLTRMGARVASTHGLPPLSISPRGFRLSAASHHLSVASAQVKSCILMAGLFADGPTTVHEPVPTRDHTERLLLAMGARIAGNNGSIRIEPATGRLDPLDIRIPGDVSSAAFILVAATIVPGSEVRIESVGINRTRAGIIHALRRMGADIAIENERASDGEPIADLTVRSSSLNCAGFEGSEIVSMIDELPLLALAATQATGTTTIRNARELRVKESDRIATTTSELRKLGARIEPLDDGMQIEGPTPLAGADVDGHGDHRLAMMLAVAGLAASGETIVRGAHVTSDSFPGFPACLASLGARVGEP